MNYCVVYFTAYYICFPVISISLLKFLFYSHLPNLKTKFKTSEPIQFARAKNPRRSHEWWSSANHDLLAQVEKKKTWASILHGIRVTLDDLFRTLPTEHANKRQEQTSLCWSRRLRSGRTARMRMYVAKFLQICLSKTYYVNGQMEYYTTTSTFEKSIRCMHINN